MLHNAKTLAIFLPKYPFRSLGIIITFSPNQELSHCASNPVSNKIRLITESVYSHAFRCGVTRISVKYKYPRSFIEFSIEISIDFTQSKPISNSQFKTIYHNVRNLQDQSHYPRSI